MQEIDIRIQELNKTICENIELIDFTSRGLVSQNILSQARNLVEHVAMKSYRYRINAGTDISKYKKYDDWKGKSS